MGLSPSSGASQEFSQASRFQRTSGGAYSLGGWLQERSPEGSLNCVAPQPHALEEEPLYGPGVHSHWTGMGGYSFLKVEGFPCGGWINIYRKLRNLLGSLGQHSLPEHSLTEVGELVAMGMCLKTGPPSSVHEWAWGHHREDRCAPQTGFGFAVAQRQLWAEGLKVQYHRAGAEVSPYRILKS